MYGGSKKYFYIPMESNKSYCFEVLFAKARFYVERGVKWQNLLKRSLRVPAWILGPEAPDNEASHSGMLCEALSSRRVASPVNTDRVLLLSKQAAQETSASPPPVAAPRVSLCNSGLFCRNKHILVLLALCSHQKSQAESHSTSWVSLHAASSLLAEASFVGGEWGRDRRNMLVLRSQAICSIIRDIMFWLEIWSDLTRVSVRQDKYWMF